MANAPLLHAKYGCTYIQLDSHLVKLKTIKRLSSSVKNFKVY